MTLRCKPGDLAVMVSTRGFPELECFLGVTVRVGHVVRNSPMHGAMWSYEGRRLIHPTRGEAVSIADACLRPIRDSGDDARDETLEWIPSPTQLDAMA